MSSKQREALSDACYAMFNFLKTHYGSCYEEMANALDKAKSALAEPVRNCDRYRTAEEAYAGFAKFCGNNSCGECRLCNRGITCSAAWLYEEY